MDYTFGLNPDALAELGAKAAVFEAIKEKDRHKLIPIHPYTHIPPGMSPEEARVNACRSADSEYFVVRASSRYELCPGTAGMTESKRFSNWKSMELEIEEVRKPTEAYLSFCKANGFEPEKAFPVIIQPMWAESYGIATSHPNQDLLMIDYFEGDDSSDRFGRRMTSSLSIFRDIKKAVEAAKTDRRWSDYRMSGADKCWARYGSAGLIKSEMDTPRARHFIEAAETLFRVLQLPEFQIFSDGYEMQAEFGPDTTTNGPILYQWKPFMKRKRTDRMVDRYNSDIVFGVCDGLELPVVKIKSGTNLTDDDFETSDSGGPRMLWQMAVNGNNKMDMAKMANYYHERELEKAAEMYPNGFCLAMSGYKEFDNIDFNRFKPKAVVIGRDFRSGMLHNRANLVQMNPVVIFSSGLYLEEADRVRISSDGVGALVEKL